MSGSYQVWNQDAPGGLTESTQAVSDGLATAQSAYQTMQVEAERFMAANGAQVLGGHSPVNAPGRQGDPDLERDAADA
jgi:hypothetical protein